MEWDVSGLAGQTGLSVEELKLIQPTYNWDRTPEEKLANLKAINRINRIVMIIKFLIPILLIFITAFFSRNKPKKKRRKALFYKEITPIKNTNTEKDFLRMYIKNKRQQ